MFMMFYKSILIPGLEKSLVKFQSKYLLNAFLKHYRFKNCLPYLQPKYKYREPQL